MSILQYILIYLLLLRKGISYCSITISESPKNILQYIPFNTSLVTTLVCTCAVCKLAQKKENGTAQQNPRLLSNTDSSMMALNRRLLASYHML